MSYGEYETLDFSFFDLAVITGPNGAGKSSILEAITWVVWDESRAGSADELIRQGTQSMWVEFIFEIERDIYRIVRKRDRKKKTGVTSLEFQVDMHNVKKPELIQLPARKTIPNVTNWKQLTEGTIRATQEKIITTLNLPYEIFVNSSYLRQGHADEFTIKTSAERKTILANILGLDLYDELEKKAREKNRVVESSLVPLQIQVEDLKQSLNQASIVKSELAHLLAKQKTYREHRKKLENRYKNLEQTQKEIELIQQKYNLEKNRYAHIELKLTQLKHDRDLINKKISDQKILLETKQLLEKEYHLLNTHKKSLDECDKKLRICLEIKEPLSKLEFEHEQIQKTIERLYHLGTCPTCLRSMSKQEADKVARELKDNFDRSRLPELQKLQEKLTDLGYDERKHHDLKSKISQSAYLEEKMRNLAFAEGTLKDCQEQIGRFESEIAEHDRERQKIITEGKTLREKLATYSQVKKSFDETVSELLSIQRESSIIEQQLGAVQEKVKQLERFREELGKKEAAIKQCLQDQTVWQELAEAFSKKGIQAMIIEQSIPQIEEEANQLLQKITDGRLQVRLETQRQKKSDNEMIETLDIVITDELGARAYELFSGGEAFRINFAIRIALSKLLSLRAGARLRFLVIDEGFGALDIAGRDDIIAAINGIRNDFAKVLIVTHLPEIKDTFQTNVEVSKDQFGSHIQLVE